MKWSTFILITNWFGYEILNSIAPTYWDFSTIMAGGMAVGITIISWIFLFIRRIDIKWDFADDVVMYVIVAFCFIWHFRCKRKIFLNPITKRWILIFTILMIILIRVLDVSIFKDGWNSAGTIFSDLPFHSSLISSFAVGVNSYSGQPKTTFYSNSTLCYPLIPDFYSSLLFKSGASLRVSISIPTVMMLASFIILLHNFVKQFSTRKSIAELTVILYATASGVGWLYLYDSEIRKNPNLNLTHSLSFSKQTFWMHSIAHYLLPQRSALFSNPLAIMSLSVVLHMSKHQNLFKESVLAGLFMGLIPMISAHTYIAVGEYALGLCVLTFPWKDPKKWINSFLFWGTFGISSLSIALPQVMWLSRGERLKGFMSIKPIWLETNDTFFSMWWWSLGTFFWLAIAHCWIFLSKKQKIIYGASIPSFVISHFWRYQPGAMDNNKVFFVSWFPFACMAVAEVLVQLPKWASLLIYPTMSLSSFVTLFKLLNAQFFLYEQPEINLGRWAMAYTKPDSVFIASGWHANPVMSLAGRQVTMGYPGWVWTHGLDADSRVNEMIKITAMKNYGYPEFLKRNWRYAIICLKRGDFYNYNKFFGKPDEDAIWQKLFEVGQAVLYRLIDPLI